jgi:hypothetical protein
MHWTISVGTLLHLLLFCAHIIINFVCCAITQPSKSDPIIPDYAHFETLYFGENETYNSDKRLIIEEFYRQSALSVKNIKNISLNASTNLSAMQSANATQRASDEGNNNINNNKRIVRKCCKDSEESGESEYN